MKSILLIGDSIRMRYQAAVREQLAGWADVWGPEQNGGTSENVLAHLDEWVLARHADVVHINCGLHDLKKEFNTETATIPLHRYEANVRAILTRIQAESNATAIWASTTPVNQEWHHTNKSFDRLESDVLAYNAAAAAICRERNVLIDDLYAVVDSVGRDTLLLPDGVHFTPEGCALLGARVADCIRAAVAG